MYASVGCGSLSAECPAGTNNLGNFLSSWAWRSTLQKPPLLKPPFLGSWTDWTECLRAKRHISTGETGHSSGMVTIQKWRYPAKFLYLCSLFFLVPSHPQSPKAWNPEKSQQISPQTSNNKSKKPRKGLKINKFWTSCFSRGLGTPQVYTPLGRLFSCDFLGFQSFELCRWWGRSQHR